MLIQKYAFWFIVFGFIFYGIYKFWQATRNPPKDLEKEIKSIKNKIEIKKLEKELKEI